MEGNIRVCCSWLDSVSFECFNKKLARLHAVALNLTRFVLVRRKKKMWYTGKIKDSMYVISKEVLEDSVMLSNPHSSSSSSSSYSQHLSVMRAAAEQLQSPLHGQYRSVTTTTHPGCARRGRV